MAIKGIIFDFDGTIVSQEIDFAKIFFEIKNLLSSYNLKKPEKDLPILEYLEQVKKINGKKAESFLKQAHHLLIEREKQASEKARPINGIHEFFLQLKKHGIKTGIVTRNSRQVVESLLKKISIPYDVLLAREDVKKVKPHPSHIDIVRKKLKLKKEQVFVVGDHPFDIIAAKKLGVSGCGVLSGGKTKQDFIRAGADFVYKDLTHLKYLLGFENLPEGKIDHQLLDYLIKKYRVLDRSVLKGPGIGEDAAVIKVRSPLISLKIDPITLVGENAGEYVVNICANDIACCGAKPAWFFASAIFPVGTKFPEIESLFREISEVCKKLNIAWVGGHTEISRSVSKTILTGAMAGKMIVKPPYVKIKEKDGLLLVKEIGIEGASILAREKDELKERFPFLVKKALSATKKPGISIVNEALIAWKSVPVIKMHDPTEGGLATGIAEIAQSLGCGFIVEEERINIYKPAKVFADFLKIDVYGLISSGCLLVVVPEKYVKKIVSIYKKKKIPVSVIGHPVKEKRILLKKKDGRIQELHFSAQDQIIGL